MKTETEKLEEIKRYLVSTGDGKAIDLLEVMFKNSNLEFAKWLRNGGTIELMTIARKYKNWSIYRQRKNDPLPFDNDVASIDSAHCKIR